MEHPSHEAVLLQAGTSSNVKGGGMECEHNAENGDAMEGMR